MFIPYRVIQIKKNKEHAKPKQPVFKFVEPVPHSLTDSIKMPDFYNMHASHEKAQNRRSSLEENDRFKRPNTTDLTNTQQHQKYYLASKNLKGKIDKNNLIFAKSNVEKQTPDVKRSQQLKHKNQNKKQNKADEKVQKFFCFNFSVSLDINKNNNKIMNMEEFIKNRKQQKTKSDSKNFKEYGHKSLDITPVFYNTINHSRDNTATERKKRPSSGNNQDHISTRQCKSNMNNFQLYISEIRKKKAWGQKKYCQNPEKESDILQVQSKIITQNKEEEITHQKLQILQQIYDKWKNSYKLHIKGKTIRKWDKKLNSGLRMEGQIESEGPKNNKKMDKSKSKKKGEDENKIDAWRISETMKRENGQFMQYDSEFTLGNEQYLYE